MKKHHVVVVGGQNTGADRLWRVANAAVELGLGDDAEVYPLWLGMRQPDRLAAHVRGRRVIQHSLGSLPVRRVVDAGAVPELVVDYCGPEPMTWGEMASRLIQKGRMARGPDADFEQREMLRHNIRQALWHPIGNTRHVPQVRGYSAFATLANYQERDIPAQAVRYKRDVVTPYRPGDEPSGVAVLLRPGLHDQILIDPATEIAAAMASLYGEKG